MWVANEMLHQCTSQADRLPFAQRCCLLAQSPAAVGTRDTQTDLFTNHEMPLAAACRTRGPKSWRTRRILVASVIHGIRALEINTSCGEEGECTELHIFVMVIDVVALHSSEITHLGIHEMKPDQNMR
jgi:hypothetical protein